MKQYAFRLQFQFPRQRYKKKYIYASFYPFAFAHGRAHLCEITQKAEHQASSNTISENWMHVYLDSTEREGEERELNLFQEKTIYIRQDIRQLKYALSPDTRK